MCSAGDVSDHDVFYLPFYFSWKSWFNYYHDGVNYKLVRLVSRNQLINNSCLKKLFRPLIKVHHS